MTREEIRQAVKELPATTPEQSREVRERLARQNPFHPPQHQDEESRLEEQAWRKQRERRKAEAEAFWARKQKQSGSPPGGQT
jgi:Tfp pilus assembly protein PilP